VHVDPLTRQFPAFRSTGRINNAYQIDLPEEYGVHTTFNVMDLTPFAGSEDEEVEACDLKTNPLQEGGDDGRGPWIRH